MLEWKTKVTNGLIHWQSTDGKWWILQHPGQYKWSVTIAGQTYTASSPVDLMVMVQEHRFRKGYKYDAT
jgi:hypothetical protein